MGTAKLLALAIVVGLFLSLAAPPVGTAPAGAPVLGDRPATRADSRASPTGHTAGFRDTSEYLLGSTAVSVIFVESEGTGDPQTENWTAGDLATAQAEILDALAWWQAQEPNASVTFDVSFLLYNVTVEPINHVCGWDAGGSFLCEEDLWVTEVMVQLGYTSGTPSTRVRTYLNDRRAALGTDWAFAAFVINSANDTDGDFVPPPGGIAANAFAWQGGPWLFLTRDNGGLGPGNISEVFAHEMGHIFYATDEYNGVPEASGYLGAMDIEGSGCLMETGVRTCLSSGTRDQVGWRDTDADAVPDIVDVEPDTQFTATPPAANPGGNLTYAGNVTVPALANLNPQDPGNDIQVADVASLAYRLDGGPWLPIAPDDGLLDSDLEPFTFNVTVTGPGPHTVEACAATAFGISETACAVHAFTVDVTLPSSSVNTPGYAITNNPVLDLLVTATDDGPIVEVTLWYSRDGGAWTLYDTDTVAPYAFTVDTRPIGDGVYGFYSMALDQAGNLEPAPATADATITVDTVAPVTSTNAILPWSSTDVPVTFTANEPATTWYRVNGGTWVTGGSVLIYTEGPNTLEFNSTDLAGNVEATRSLTVGVDKSRPNATLRPLPAVTNNPSLLLDWDASDAVSGLAAVEVYYRRSGEASWTLIARTLSPPLAWTIPQDGTFEFATVAEDAAQNREDPASAPEAATTLDTRGPRSVIVGLPEFHDALAFNVTVVASDDLSLDHVELWLRHDIGNFTLWANGTTGNDTFLVDASALGEGTYTLYSIAVDSGGNREPEPAVKNATVVDVTRPVVAVSTPTPAPGWLVSSSPLLQWTMTDAVSLVARAEVKVDDGPWVDVGLNTSRTLPDLDEGPHTAYLRVTDHAGNERLVSWDLQVDTVAPSVAISTPGANETLGNRTAVVTWTASDATSGVVRVTVTLDAEPPLALAPDNATWTFAPLPVGTHRVVVQAVDAAGNSAHGEVVFHVPANPDVGGDPQAPFSIWPVLFLLAVALALVILFLLSRRRRKPAFPGHLDAMHKVQAEAPTEDLGAPPAGPDEVAPESAEPAEEAPRRRRRGDAL
jgi:hypothetical protein